MLIARKKLPGTERERILENIVRGPELVAGLSRQLFHAAAMDHQQHQSGQEDKQGENWNQYLRGETQFYLLDGGGHVINISGGL